jgi:hypothetical protein
MRQMIMGGRGALASRNPGLTPSQGGVMRCDALAANRDSAKKKFGYKSANMLGR